MPRTNALPKYRKHRASGQAVVSLSGQDFYLGPHGTKTSKLEYDRLVAEWLQRGRMVQPNQPASTVTTVLVAYLKYAKTYYRKNGKETREVGCLTDALRFVRELYGKTPADEFGPVALQVVRGQMIQHGWTRKYINKQVGRIVRCFRWAASQEMVSPTVAQGLATLSGLHKGRTEAPDRPPVQPVAEDVYQATLPHLPPIVADMARFQRLTGCRPQDVCNVRPCDVDRSGDVWLYRPESHKTEHHGRQRIIAIGPKAQAVLRPYLLRGAEEHCFRPCDTERKLRQERNAKRKTPIGQGNVEGTNRKSQPKRTPGTKYTTQSYGRAIQRACDLAFPAPEGTEGDALEAWRKRHRWAPNRLRHSAGTEVRAKFGLEAAQVVLGHAAADVTQIYAERDLALATQVAREVG